MAANLYALSEAEWARYLAEHRAAFEAQEQSSGNTASSYVPPATPAEDRERQDELRRIAALPDLQRPVWRAPSADDPTRGVPAWARARHGAELPPAVRGYLISGGDDPAVYDATADFLYRLSLARRRDPLRGFTRGELAEQALALEAVEREQRRAVSPGGSVRVTELRDIEAELPASKPYWTRARLLRAAQSVPDLPQRHRIRSCLKVMTDHAPTRDGEKVVEVVARIPEPQPQLQLAPEVIGEWSRATFRGVGVCGNLWGCPNCAPRRTEQRRRELQVAVREARRQGYAVALLTLTFRHSRSDDLAASWKALADAEQRFNRCYELKQCREALGAAGKIKAREATYGQNGWHPHSHALLLFDNTKCTAGALEHWAPQLKAAWRRVCVQAGLGEPTLEHGLDISLTQVETYIAKWGLDSELARWHMKRGRVNTDAPAELALNGYTPFDLLAIAAGELEAHPALKLTKSLAGFRYAEFVRASHGSSQLRWSKGLRDLLEVETALAELELAERDEPAPQVVGELTAAEWNVLVTSRFQIDFLGMVSARGFEFAKVMLDRWREDITRYGAYEFRRTMRNRGLSFLWSGSGKRAA